MQYDDDHYYHLLQGVFSIQTSGVTTNSMSDTIYGTDAGAKGSQVNKNAQEHRCTLTHTNQQTGCLTYSLSPGLKLQSSGGFETVCFQCTKGLLPVKLQDCLHLESHMHRNSSNECLYINMPKLSHFSKSQLK